MRCIYVILFILCTKSLGLAHVKHGAEKAPKILIKILNDPPKSQELANDLKRIKDEKNTLKIKRRINDIDMNFTNPLSKNNFDLVLNERMLTPRPYRTLKGLRHGFKPNLRDDRDAGRRRRDDSESSLSRSPEEEYKWKDRWKQIWKEKKIEAMNITTPRADFVNMIAARPWGKQCGEPKEEFSTGTCMLPNECEAEFRIYRGDYDCGNTQFICCGIQHAAYDFYQAFDASFASSNMNTDSESSDSSSSSSGGKRSRHRKKLKKRRKKARKQRKRRIASSIKKIVKQIRKLLNKMKKRGEKARKWKTKQLNRYVKYLKKQYIMDLDAVEDIHAIELIKVDDNLMRRLKIMERTNEVFRNKKEFIDIVISGYMTRNVARQLFTTFPELQDVIETRRDGRDLKNVPKFFDYNIEYGFLYY